MFLRTGMGTEQEETKSKQTNDGSSQKSRSKTGGQRKEEGKFR